MSARVRLARALVSLGNRAEAEKEIDLAAELAVKSQNRAAHLDFSIAAAGIRAASEQSADLADAVRTLNVAFAEATKYGYPGYQFEARLSIGKLEVKSGAPSNRAAGRERLEVLQRDATRKGFLLIARKAAAALGEQSKN